MTNPDLSEADVAKRTCVIDDCGLPHCSRGLCRKHYNAWWHKTDHPPRVCGGCGAPLPGRGGKRFCGPDCRPRCRVDGCLDPAERAKTTLCVGHFAQQLRYGEATPHKFKWSDPAPCKVCGVENDYRLRAFCSWACYDLHRRYGGNVPTTKPCLACGEPIDLMEVGKGGQRKHRVVVFCKPCGNRRTKYNGANVRTLARRDGTDCALCGEPIDMTLRRNHPGGFMCASVDHILPQSLGGTHDLANLQLAHLLCNLRKSNRVPASLPEVMP